MARAVIKDEYKQICKRFSKIMNSIGCEHVAVDPDSRLSEIWSRRMDYGIEDGVTLYWMWKEADYWLSCNYEEGNCRYDDRLFSKEAYRSWASEVGKLKRLKKAIEKYGDLDVCVEVL